MSEYRAAFLASLPPIQSAIKRSGDNSGMRIQLDIPESEVEEGYKVMRWGQTVLKVVIEPMTQENCTELNDEAEKIAEGAIDSLDSRRIDLRRNQ